MARFWWVNHKQTARHEIADQYLWSPKFESGKAGPKRSQFYDNMRRASPGDLVLSYADGMLRFVGRVTEFAFTAPKPAEFGNVGAYWNNEGWYLPVFWVPLGPPVRPRDFIDVLGPLLPEKYSPIGPLSGDGHQKAYLSEIDQAVFEAVASRTTFDAVSLETGGANSLGYLAVSDRLDDIVEQAIASDSGLEATVRQRTIEARRGQGQFRRNVEAISRSCRLTGVSDPNLLIASHIKPWRACASAHERLDGMNGLMLTPDADLLFDRGLITFEGDGQVKISPRVDHLDLRRLGLGHLTWNTGGVSEGSAMAWDAMPFVAEQVRYLDYHRSQVFVGEL
jgi:putative restriction endonuclease